MILQWNCRGLLSKWGDMKHLFSVLTPILIALQETWFLPTDPPNFGITNYSLYRQDDTTGGRRRGGVALYVCNDFVHSQINLNTEIQAVACTLRLNGRHIDFCSLYVPPDTDDALLHDGLRRLVSQLKNPYVLLGDFNAHSPAWSRDYVQTDRRGRIIENFIDNHRLVLLNTGANTHLNLGHNTQSAIDLSLCSASLGNDFDWEVDGDIYDSDHFPIKLIPTFLASGDSVPNFVPRWNVARADWDKFLDKAVITHEPFISPEKGISFITNTILTAAFQAVPMTNHRTRRIPVPWWCQEVALAIARRKRAFRGYLRHPDIPHLMERNRERAKTRRIIREAKRRAWLSFLQKMTSITPLSQIWESIRRLSGKRRPNPLTPVDKRHNIK